MHRISLVVLVVGMLAFTVLGALWAMDVWFDRRYVLAVVARAPSFGILSSELVAIATTLGIARSIDGRIVLDEELFVQLQEDAETQLVYEELLPVVDALHAWLDAS